MANNQDLQEDFSQDVKDDQRFNGDDGTGENENEHDTENGNEHGNDGQNENDQAGQQGEASTGRDDNRKLFVGGLSGFDNVERVKDDLNLYFQKYGSIKDIEVAENPFKKGKPMGYAFITFEAATSIKTVVDAPHDKNECGKLLKIEPAQFQKCTVVVKAKSQFVEIEKFFGLEEPNFLMSGNCGSYDYTIFLESEQILTELLQYRDINGIDVQMGRKLPSSNGSSPTAPSTSPSNTSRFQISSNRSSSSSSISSFEFNNENRKEIQSGESQLVATIDSIITDGKSSGSSSSIEGQQM